MDRMKHLGDICGINGAEIPTVDVITGGSPCQDLSIAGNRKGLEGERSGLFMEQIRIIKEMREAGKKSGRTDEFVRPRYCVWENVPGAFSSNKGEDFQAVLTEFVRVSESDAPDVPLPEKGKWPKAGCVYDNMGGWSVAWRVHDAQFWGVPQRRKRIALVADFNGLTAPDILFDPQYRREAEGTDADETQPDPGGQRGREVPTQRESVSGNPEPGGTQGQGAAEGTEGSVGGAIRFQEQTGNITAGFMGGQGSKAGGLGYHEEVSPSLKSVPSGGNTVPDIVQAVHQNASGEVRESDVSYTVGTNQNASGRNTPLIHEKNESWC